MSRKAWNVFVVVSAVLGLADWPENARRLWSWLVPVGPFLIASSDVALSVLSNDVVRVALVGLAVSVGVWVNRLMEWRPGSLGRVTPASHAASSRPDRASVDLSNWSGVDLPAGSYKGAPSKQSGVVWIPARVDRQLMSIAHVSPAYSELVWEPRATFDARIVGGNAVELTRRRPNGWLRRWLGRPDRVTVDILERFDS